MAHEYTTWAYAQDVDQPLAKFVLVCLADACDADGVAFPGQKRLSRMTGMGERTVRRHVAWLEARGFLRRTERRRPDGSRSSDSYALPPKDATGQIGHLFTTGQTGRKATGQTGRQHTASPQGTNPVQHAPQPDPPVPTAAPTNRPNTTGSPAKLAGHEPPENHQKDQRPTPPTPPRHELTERTTTIAATPRTTTDLEAFRRAWNEHRRNLPQALSLNARRKNMLRTLVKEHGEDALPLFTDAVRAVSHNDFWTERRYGMEILLNGKVLKYAEEWRAGAAALGGGDMRLATQTARWAEALKDVN